MMFGLPRNEQEALRRSRMRSVRKALLIAKVRVGYSVKNGVLLGMQVLLLPCTPRQIEYDRLRVAAENLRCQGLDQDGGKTI